MLTDLSGFGSSSGNRDGRGLEDDVYSDDSDEFERLVDEEQQPDDMAKPDSKELVNGD